MGKFFICCWIQLKFCLRVRLKHWNNRNEFELDGTKSKNNIAENSVALGHDTHNNSLLVLHIRFDVTINNVKPDWSEFNKLLTIQNIYKTRSRATFNPLNAVLNDWMFVFEWDHMYMCCTWVPNGNITTISDNCLHCIRHISTQYTVECWNP